MVAALHDSPMHSCLASGEQGSRAAWHLTQLSTMSRHEWQTSLCTYRSSCSAPVRARTVPATLPSAVRPVPHADDDDVLRCRKTGRLALNNHSANLSLHVATVRASDDVDSGRSVGVNVHVSTSRGTDTEGAWRSHFMLVPSSTVSLHAQSDFTPCGPVSYTHTYRLNLL
jgi:hypothetical protein